MNLEQQKTPLFARPMVMVAVAILCCALWGSATPAIKTGYRLLEVEGVPSIMLFAGIRFFLAGVLTVLIVSVARRKILFPKKENWGRVMTVSAFQTVIQYILFYLGLAYTSGIKGPVSSGTTAFFSLLLAASIFKQEKLTAKKIIACVMGFVGIVIINLDGLSFSGEWLDLMGVGFVVLSTIAYAVSSVLIKRYSTYEDPVTISGYQFIIGGAFMAIVGFAIGGSITLTSLGGVLDLIYLALLSAIAYSLWGLRLKHNPVSKVTVFTCATPIFGTILTMLLLPGESNAVNPVNLVITLFLVSSGILLLNYRKSEKK